MWFSELFKSVQFVFIVYISFILNNSLSSLLSTDPIVIVFISLIMTDLLNMIYKVVFSHPPGTVFLSLSFMIVLQINSIFSFFDQQVIVIFGIYISLLLFSYIDRFTSFENRISSFYASKFFEENDICTQVSKGLFFNKQTTSITKNLSVLPISDKIILYDLLKNTNGVISFDDTVTVTIQQKELKFRFPLFSKAKTNKKAQKMEQILKNVIIEQHQD